MKTKIEDQIRQEHLQRGTESKIKITITLTGHPAKQFLQMHHSLQKDRAISQSELAGQIVALALHHDARGRRQKTYEQTVG